MIVDQNADGHEVKYDPPRAGGKTKKASPERKVQRIDGKQGEQKRTDGRASEQHENITNEDR